MHPAPALLARVAASAAAVVPKRLACAPSVSAAVRPAALFGLPPATAAATAAAARRGLATGVLFRAAAATAPSSASPRKTAATIAAAAAASAAARRASQQQQTRLASSSATAESGSKSDSQSDGAGASQSWWDWLWNSPVGIKTVHFWAPVMKWALVAAGLADMARPAEKLSVMQNVALTATGLIWTRWCLIITPKNYMLAAANFFLGVAGLVQCVRIYLARSALAKEGKTAE